MDMERKKKLNMLFDITRGVAIESDPVSSSIYNAIQSLDPPLPSEVAISVYKLAYIVVKMGIVSVNDAIKNALKFTIENIYPQYYMRFKRELCSGGFKKYHKCVDIWLSNRIKPAPLHERIKNIIGSREFRELLFNLCISEKYVDQIISRMLEQVRNIKVSSDDLWTLIKNLVVNADRLQLIDIERL